MLPAVLVSLVLAQGSPSMAGPNVATIHSATSGNADIFTLLPDAPALATQCTGDALTSTQGVSVTFDRDSTAYCTKGDGSMVLVDADEPRVQANGVLREGARTNVVLRSQAFDNASWIKHSTGGPAVPSVTADAAAAPDGTTTADRVDFDATVSGSQRTYLQQSYTATAVARSLSLYVKGVSGSGTLHIMTTPDAVTYITGTCNYTASAWARCSVTGTPTATTWNFLIGSDLRDSGQTPKPAQSVYLWAAQEEIGGFASSYIPTAGTSATRSAETIAVEVPQDIDTEGCFAVTATHGTTVPAANWVEADGIALFANSSTEVAIDDGNDTATATVSSLASRSVTARGYWSGSTMGVSADGVTDEATFDGSASSDNAVTIGNGSFAEFRNIRVDNKAGGCK